MNENYIIPKGLDPIINKFCLTIGLIPSSYLISLTYEEQLLSIGKYLDEQVRPALNNNAEAVAQLQLLFTDLKNYVENYFDNLDVQEEINNKLDDMIESGYFDNILNNYLNLQKIYATTSDLLQSSETFAVGQKIKTLGYYTINDGGGAEFVVSDAQNTNIIQFSLYGSMYANMIINNNTIYLKQLGLKPGDENFNNSTILYNALSFSQKMGIGNIEIGFGNFYFSTPIVVDFEIDSLKLFGSRGVNNKGSNLFYTGTSYFISFNERCNNFTLEDFKYICDNNYGLSFNLTFHKGIIKNVTCANALGGLRFNTGTYSYVENYGFSSNNALTEFGIQIGDEILQSYTTEFFYINRCSIDFQRVGTGACIKILKCSGGIYLNNNDLCNTKGHAILVDNKNNSTSNYFQFDNNNISGAKIGIELYAENGSLGGVFITNQRIALNYEDTDELMIYTHAESGKSISMITKNLYLRSRSGGTTPSYLCKFSNLSLNSQIDITDGENFNIPVQLNSAVSVYKDYRMKKLVTLNSSYFTATGDVKIPLSTLNILEKTISANYYIPVSVNSGNNIYYVNTVVESGIPKVVLRVSELPTTRTNIIVGEGFTQIVY